MFIHSMSVYRPPHIYSNEDVAEIFQLKKGPKWAAEKLQTTNRYSMFSPETMKDPRFQCSDFSEYVKKYGSNKEAEFHYKSDIAASRFFRMHVAQETGITPSFLGAQALRDAINKAGIKKEDIDIIICSNDTPEFGIPNTGDTIAAKLDINPKETFDIQAACSSFAYHMMAIKRMSADPNFKPKKIAVIEIGTYWLCVNAGVNSSDPYFWSDAANASIISLDTEKGLAVTPGYLGSCPGNINGVMPKVKGSLTGDMVINIPSYGYFYQLGKEVFKFARKKHVDMMVDMKQMFNVIPDWYVFHQPNGKLHKACVEMLKSHDFKPEAHISNVCEVANTAGAACPSVIVENWDSYKSGDNIFYATLGAGLHFGCGKLEKV